MPDRPVNPSRPLWTWIALLAGVVAAAGCSTAERDASLPTNAEILRLEDRRSTGDGALMRLLAAGDRDVRIRAALALGRIGTPPAHASDLAVTVEDSDTGIRAMGIFSLGEMGDPNAVAMLLPHLSDADVRCRGLAAEALGKLSDPNAIPPLVIALGDDDDEVAGLASIAIFRLETGPGVGEQAQVIQNLYRDGSAARRASAVYFLMRTQIKHPASRAPHDALVALSAANDSDPLIRSWAARGIGACNTADSSHIVPLASDVDWRVRVEAFNALRRHGGTLPWQTWEAGVDDPHPAVAIAALGALEKCPAPEAKARLERDLEHATPRFREIALTALAARDKEKARDRLRPLRGDPAWSVRARLVEAAPVVGDGETFAKLSADQDPRVRTAAAGALAAALDRFPLVEMGLISDRLLIDKDPYVRSTALDVVASLPPEKREAGHVPNLKAAYYRALPDKEEEARLSALAGLALAGGDAARDAVVPALRDPAYLVRRKAAEILRDTFSMDHFAEVGEAETPFTPQDYLEAVDRAGKKVTAAFETEAGSFRIELHAADAPLTVHNFIELARAGELDNRVFHRVVPGFVIQDGDPRGDGNSGPPWRIRCEINMRRYVVGAVGMALSGKDTGGSQYFVTQTPQPHLDGGYTLFGQILEGQDVVDRLVQGTTIRKVTISEE